MNSGGILARLTVACRAGGVEFVLRRGQMLPVFDTGSYAMLVDALELRLQLVEIDEAGRPLPEEPGQACDPGRYRLALERSLRSRPEAELVGRVDREPLGGVSGSYVSRLHELDPLIGLDPGCAARGGGPAWESQAISYRTAERELLPHYLREASPQRAWATPCFYVEVPAAAATAHGVDVYSRIFRPVVPAPLPVMLRPLSGYNRALRADWTVDDAVNAVVRRVSCYPDTTLYLGYGLLPQPMADVSYDILGLEDWQLSAEASSEVALLATGRPGCRFHTVARSGWAMLHDVLHGGGFGAPTVTASEGGADEEPEEIPTALDAGEQIELT